MDLEDIDYLEPDFDPSTLRVAELRRILLEHEIDYRSSAKKAELVSIFNETIAAQASTLLQQRQNPGRSRNVIEDASKSPAKTPRRKLAKKHVMGSDEDELTGPEPATVTKSVRPRKVAKLEEEELRIPVTLKKSTSPRKSMKMDVDTEEEDAPPVKRSPRKSSKMELDDEVLPVVSRSPRKSTVKASPRKVTVRISPKKRAQVKDSDGDEDMTDASEAATVKEEAAFSSENPFQSGSPKPGQSATKRRQTSVLQGTPKLPPPSIRRKTDIAPPIVREEFVSSRAPKTPLVKERFMPPIESLLMSPAFQSAAQRAKENALAEDQLAAGEEFTPEEALTVPRPLHEQPSITWQMIKFLTVTALTFGSLSGAAWYRREQLAAGWCGLDSEPTVRPPHANSLQDIIQQVRPNCLPCPPHAVCSPGFRMTCVDEFTRREHPLSFGGLVPFSPECVPDTEKLRKIEEVADRIIGAMRDRTAAIECGTAEPGETLSMTETELHEAALGAQPTPEEEALFPSALKDAVARDEVERSSSYDFLITDKDKANHRKPQGEPTYEGLGEVDHHITYHYHSTSFANLPLTCRARRSFERVVARYRVEAAGVLAFLLGVLYLRHFFKSRNELRARVVQLVSLVYSELLEAKAKSMASDRHVPQLGVSQLRDAVLKDEFSYKERERLWHEVGKVVEANSNVRATQAEIQGEWLRAWEWVGPVKDLERFAAGNQRQVGDVSEEEFIRPVV